MCNVQCACNYALCVTTIGELKMCFGFFSFFSIFFWFILCVATASSIAYDCPQEYVDTLLLYSAMQTSREPKMRCTRVLAPFDTIKTLQIFHSYCSDLARLCASFFLSFSLSLSVSLSLSLSLFLSLPLLHTKQYLIHFFLHFTVNINLALLEFSFHAPCVAFSTKSSQLFIAHCMRILSMDFYGNDCQFCKTEN